MNIQILLPTHSNNVSKPRLPILNKWRQLLLGIVVVHKIPLYLSPTSMFTYSLVSIIINQTYMCIAVIARICDEAEISLPDPYSVTNDVHPFVYILLRYKVSLPYHSPDQCPDTLHQTNLLKPTTSNRSANIENSNRTSRSIGMF